jgi:hypothetical protein
MVEMEVKASKLLARKDLYADSTVKIIQAKKRKMKELEDEIQAKEQKLKLELNTEMDSIADIHVEEIIKKFQKETSFEYSVHTDETDPSVKLLHLKYFGCIKVCSFEEDRIWLLKLIQGRLELLGYLIEQHDTHCSYYDPDCKDSFQRIYLSINVSDKEENLKQK